MNITPFISQVVYSQNDKRWSVVWRAPQTELDNYELIASWDIYRLIGITWTKIGTKDMTITNGLWYVFTDSDDTNAMAYQHSFRIKGVYQNGTTTDFSATHKTVHVIANCSVYPDKVNLKIMPYMINGMIPDASSIHVFKGTCSNSRIEHVIDIAPEVEGASYEDTLNSNTYYIADTYLDGQNPSIRLNTLSVSPSTMVFNPSGSNCSFAVTSDTVWNSTDNVSWLTSTPTSYSGCVSGVANPIPYCCGGSASYRCGALTFTSNKFCVEPVSINFCQKNGL